MAGESSQTIAGAPEPSTMSSDKPEPITRTREGLQKVLLDQYVTRDFFHAAALQTQIERERNLLEHRRKEVNDYKAVRTTHRDAFPPSKLFGMGYEGYGNGRTDQKPQLMYPAAKPRPGRKRTIPFKAKRKDMLNQAEQIEELVPIRLDVEWDKVKLRDTFTWNLHDRIIDMPYFVKQMVEDFGLEGHVADRVYEQIMAQAIDQVTEYFPAVYVEEDALDSELPYSAYKNDEIRILIKLNITIGKHTLVDQFEWDINNPSNSPEEFAMSMTRDLSLAGEFTTAIAHCIREQSQLFTKSLYIVGHPFDGRPIEEADLLASIQPSPILSAFRPQQQAKDYVPSIWENTEAELERNELVFSREQRRQKRSVNRRGGPSLPDLKDRQRTVRTLVVHSVLPGAATSIEDSRLFKRTTGLRGKRGKGEFDSESEEEEEDNALDSPAAQLQGTARTRGMRGAATAAQQRMANVGRSETPEALLHHHETRTSARRFGGGREESMDSVPSLIVRLKLGKETLQRLARDRRGGRAHNLPPGTQFTPVKGQGGTSAFPTPAPPGSMGPPTTPGLQNRALGNPAVATSSTASSTMLGRVDAAPPTNGQPPPPAPPPAWLLNGLEKLRRESYPEDNFEGTMRYSAFDKITNLATQIPPAGAPIPSHVVFAWLPRIRCLDCPGKLYTPGPGITVENFEVHLKNRIHREKVDIRRNRG